MALHWWDTIGEPYRDRNTGEKCFNFQCIKCEEAMIVKMSHSLVAQGVEERLSDYEVIVCLNDALNRSRSDDCPGFFVKKEMMRIPLRPEPPYSVEPSEAPSHVLDYEEVEVSVYAP